MTDRRMSLSQLKQAAEIVLKKQIQESQKSANFQKDLDAMLTKTTSAENRFKALNLLLQIKLKELEEMADAAEMIDNACAKLKNLQ